MISYWMYHKMKKIYLKVPIIALTSSIVKSSNTANIYEARRTKDGKFVMLSFKEEDIPVELFQAGALLYTPEEALVELESSDWPQGEETATLATNVQHQTVNSPFAAKQLPNGKKIYIRVEGISAVLAEGPNIVSFSIPYTQVKFNELEIIGASTGDKVNLKVLDSANGTYSGQPNYMFNQFGKNVYPSKDFYKRKSDYDADLYYGMQICVEIETSTAKTIYINFILHELKD